MLEMVKWRTCWRGWKLELALSETEIGLQKFCHLIIPATDKTQQQIQLESEVLPWVDRQKLYLLSGLKLQNASVVYSNKAPEGGIFKFTMGL